MAQGVRVCAAFIVQGQITLAVPRMETVRTAVQRAINLQNASQNVQRRRSVKIVCETVAHPVLQAIVNPKQGCAKNALLASVEISVSKTVPSAFGVPGVYITAAFTVPTRMKPATVTMVLALPGARRAMNHLFVVKVTPNGSIPSAQKVISDSGKSNTGAIVGGSVAAVVVVAAGVIAGMFMLRWRKMQRTQRRGHREHGVNQGFSSPVVPTQKTQEDVGLAVQDKYPEKVSSQPNQNHGYDHVYMEPANTTVYFEMQ
ncbi:hypothetical protein ElyMa_005188100 [Elysia marginata]|uniref:Uncharacterized protein n=1 Tax=Elysia marginata TaxID=1093978 RepID=A0AAV4JT43_9GAST|nr:hypothetical protein ElyMa_005188100 [Elysia marginata]